ncbi:AAA family ATPase [Agrobacterium fabrum]|uniref:AAA family ATPase n=1 Tax=Agrobacterium fabrum TaxID=1176649 RepID=UPI002473E436|nr:AAA family ATPase [Agrobacterium fabrum]MDH6297848.1 adenylate kinase [Agrobacterium fabrum]
MIFVAGLSKSGKTHTLKAAIDGDADVQHVIASDLLKSSGMTLHPTGINQIEENQKVLLDRLLCIQVHPNIRLIIDGHFIIENGSDVVDVPEWFFDRLLPSSIIVVDDPSDAFILRRRDTRFVSSSDALVELRLREFDRASHIAHRLGVPLTRVNSGDTAAMRSAIASAR